MHNRAAMADKSVRLMPLTGKFYSRVVYAYRWMAGKTENREKVRPLAHSC